MSRKNSLENKKKRREEREVNAVRLEKERAIQARLQYLAYAPPDTYEELEELVDEALDEVK